MIYRCVPRPWWARWVSMERNDGLGYGYVSGGGSGLSPHQYINRGYFNATGSLSAKMPEDCVMEEK